MSDIIIDRQAAIDEPLLPSLEQLTHWVGCVFLATRMMTA